MVERMSNSLQPVQVGASYGVDRYDACISFFIHHVALRTFYCTSRVYTPCSLELYGGLKQMVCPHHSSCHHHLQLAYRRWYKQVKLAIYHHDGGGGAGLLSIQQRN